ncbi:hypothetical protein O3668_11500 [Staphylococcus capitis]|uniref:hypothetical protein n=1 Tax=Staphylococcus capitis TaxID=29388 RepID=UPI00352C919E
MIKKYKEINLESIEMIDSYYFFIQKEPKFYCLEIFNTDTVKEQKDILKKIMGNNQTTDNNIGKMYYSSGKTIKIVYSSDSLKALREHTANLNLALEEDIIEFINKLNKNIE